MWPIKHGFSYLNNWYYRCCSFHVHMNKQNCLTNQFAIELNWFHLKEKININYGFDCLLVFDCAFYRWKDNDNRVQFATIGALYNHTPFLHIRFAIVIFFFVSFFVRATISLFSNVDLPRFIKTPKRWLIFYFFLLFINFFSNVDVMMNTV